MTDHELQPGARIRHRPRRDLTGVVKNIEYAGGMNSLAYYHTLPTTEQDAYQWLVSRGNHLPALHREGPLKRTDRREGVAYTHQSMGKDLAMSEPGDQTPATSMQHLSIHAPRYVCVYTDGTRAGIARTWSDLLEWVRWCYLPSTFGGQRPIERVEDIGA